MKDASSLKITDIRFADIDGAPKRYTLMKVFTNQGLVGYGEVRDASSRTYAAMLKSRILGENQSCLMALANTSAFPFPSFLVYCWEPRTMVSLPCIRLSYLFSYP